jgi:chromosome segregation ATPase
MKPDRSQAMHDARRLDSQHKRALVGAAADAALTRGGSFSIAGIARQAGVGRKFIYDHPDLKAEIELKVLQASRRQANDILGSAQLTGASLRAELENSRAQARRLAAQLRALEGRLSKAEGARLVADDLLPDEMVAELAGSRLAQRASELEQQLFEAKDQLRRTTEELEAARSINRELMQQANRPRPPAGTDSSSRARGPNAPPTPKED